MPIAWYLAIAFLREGRSQSLLIGSAVGVGVGVIVFLSALISGLQRDLIAKTLGTQAHVTLEAPSEPPRRLVAASRPEATVLTHLQQTIERPRTIASWRPILLTLEARPEVDAASPVLQGPALAFRGAVSRSVALIGLEAARFTRVVDVETRLVRGRLPRGGAEATIGTELATALGLTTGDKLRTQGAGGRQERFDIVGVFDLGNRDVNERWVLVPLRASQTLLDVDGAISSVDLRLTDAFSADDVARDLERATGLVATSWMQKNAQLLSALRSQSNSSFVIQFFVALAVTIGIASVLVVSVVQKRRQIGILRAMGVSRGRVAQVFLFQGIVVGLGGSVAGSAGGLALARVFERYAVDPAGQPLFAIDVSASLLFAASALAILTGLLAATLPAIRAARLDPAVAIRQE